jgi:nitrite reductase/ring-hydroxylating ferredoxin subunit
VLETELECAHAIGWNAVEMAARAPLPSFDTGPCLRFPRQGQFHPMKYLAGIVGAFERRGGRIYTDTHVSAVSGGCRPSVRSESGCSVRAEAVVVATNTPIHDNLQIHFKQVPYRTYVVGMRVPRGAVPRALYWDTPHPYHYVRLQQLGPEHELLIVGGEDHRSGEEDDGQERFTTLEEWTRERFPAGETLFCWSGQVMEPSDGPAFIGRDLLDQQNVYVATGDSGQGMTHGTIAGMLLTDLIAGRPNRWSTVYDPTRFPVQSTTWYQDAFDELWHYAELFTSGDVDYADAIDKGEGAVIRRGLEKFAVYRDEQGVLHEFSAICPHLGCVVQWNSAEAMWNCPCHGSQFHSDGTLAGGPARIGLSRSRPGHIRSQQR